MNYPRELPWTLSSIENCGLFLTIFTLKNVWFTPQQMSKLENENKWL